MCWSFTPTTCVVHSPLLSSQIRQSFCANAFNVFQRSMYQIDIVRLCALWDSVDIDKENIPTVIELIQQCPLCARERPTIVFGPHVANGMDRPRSRPRWL
jgi:hypothetical protein